MRIVITGALGHIGSRLIRELPSVYPGAEFVLLDNLATQRYCSLFNLPGNVRYRFLEFDILDGDLSSVLKDGDTVVHLAALTDAASSFANREEVERVNLLGTSKVARACVETGCKLLHVSSTSVYGTEADTVSEDCSEAELRPQSPYAATKLEEEKLLQRMAQAQELRFVICRFGTICGVSPGMRFHTAVNKFCWQAVMGQPLSVWTTALHQKRPYLDLADAVTAIKLIFGRDLFDCQIYNVLTDNLTVNSIIDMIRVRVPQVAICYVDSPAMNVLSYDVSVEKLRRKGLELQGSVASCITETIEMLRRARFITSDVQP